ncbi:MAG: dephospho-CoA kinase [Rhodanobacter sp. SCN 67-45]|jgi:dephospho-CoA kinase|nr:MAG: dephospho-CoA kinase [Rhodanobacter sp. SCN 67-45]
MSGGPRLVVALTGGVAAGKSAVTRRFEALGVPVHDADVAAREVIAPGSEGLAEVVATFGADVLDDRGELDRPSMRRRVFADPAARRRLEAIIHPRVRAWLRERAQSGSTPYCLLAIPLLAENIAQYRWVDRVLVVDVPESVQLARLIARDGVDEALARRMIEQQATRAERLALADDVIDNSGDESALDQPVAELHQRYLALATA